MRHIGLVRELLCSQFQKAFHNGKEVLNRPWHILTL
jgi:hypothetical protein